MSTANFIKYPWVPYFGGSGIIEIHNIDGIEVVSWQGFDGNECTESENISHAYLIASAPEMYEEIEHEHAALLWEIQNFIVEDEEDEKKLRKLQMVADRKAKILEKARGEDV